MKTEPFSVVGVDLGAQQTNTAYCVIAVDPRQGAVTIRSPKSGPEATDDKLLEVFSGKVRIGIDAPFGWPVAFIDAISQYRDVNRWNRDEPTVYPGKENTKIEYRNLKYRKTDLNVWEAIDKRPLGVATELIGAVAMRAARLVARAECELGLEVDRSGQEPHFLEVYPAAAFKRWEIETSRINEKGVTKSYKKDREVRSQVLRDMSHCLNNWLHNRDEYSRTDHQVDALVSALVTLMAELDRRLYPLEEDRLIEPLPPDVETVAKQEGWITLPRRCSLHDLAARVRELMNA